MFRGRPELDVEKLKAGRLAALRNAEELVREAEILYENGAWSRSCFLSYTAGEDLGKYLMMTSAVSLALGGAISWKSFWRRFRNHQSKIGNMLVWESLRQAGKLSEYREKGKEEKEQNAAVRTLYLYSDFDGSDFYHPSEVIGEEHARVILALAKQRLSEQQEIERRVYAEGYLDTLTPEKVREMWRRMGMEDFFLKLYKDD